MTVASCVVLLLASCGNSYKRDDKIHDRETGHFVGTILEVGSHHVYDNGISGPSIRFRRDNGEEAWALEDAFTQSYEVRR